MNSKLVMVLALAVSAGCGGGSDDGGDGVGPDGGAMDDSDAEPEPTIGPCSVERAGLPLTAVFHDRDGTPLAVIDSDEDDIARYGSCVEGGMVTVSIPLLAGGGGGTFSKLITVQGVNAGDHVLLDPPAAEQPSTGPLTITVQNGDDLVSGGADSYVARLGDCGDFEMALDDEHGGELALDDLDEWCLGYDPSDFSVVSLAKDGEGQKLALARVDSDDLVDPVTASGGTWVAHPGPTQVALHNWPADVINTFLVVSPLIDGAFYSRDSQSFDLLAETIEVDYWPSVIADEHRLSLSLSWDNLIWSVLRMRTGEAPPSTIDLSTDLLAPPRQLVVNVTDPMRPRYVWQGGDSRAEYTRAELTWTTDTHLGVWIVVAPGNPGQVQVPVLPEQLAGSGPSAEAQTVAGRLVLADKGLDYADWLSGGLSTAYYEENTSPVELSEGQGITLRHVGYSPGE